MYQKYGTTVFATVQLLDTKPVFWVADEEAIKTITTEKHIFQKDVEGVSLTFLGILTSLTSDLVSLYHSLSQCSRGNFTAYPT